MNKKIDWIPQNVEASLRFGGGMLASGYGFSFSGSFGYHFLPSRYYLGVYAQSIIAFDEVGEETVTSWGSLGLSLGANVGDINPDLLIKNSICTATITGTSGWEGIKMQKKTQRERCVSERRTQ